ncbi:hypothetical protein ACKKBF_B21570 [Auxenochlorella protothecoides x Auxenochlorella symbiontica]
MFRTCFAATIAEVKGARQAFITSRFEIDSKGLPTDANILEFCFPLGAAAVVPKEYQAVEEFLFALTGGGGDRLYGFCRHSLPPNRPGEGNGRGIAKLQRYPQALCIVSPHPWAQFFFRVLEVLDRTLRALPSPTLNGHAFLRDLDAAAPAALGSVLRLPWPACLHVGSLPRQHRAFASPADPGAWLAAGEGGVLELEVPPDVGGGASTAGIPLAPLLWHLTPRLAVSLLAALLMERRVVVVSADLGRLTAAVAAAAALLHPFHWQHIFLPLVPASLLDYLAAPMPFLAGVPAACLPTLRTLAMEEVLLIDLDTLGSASPPPGGPRDDALLLPHADALEAAFDDLRDLQRSPAEAASTPKAAEIVRAWAVRVFGGYRAFLRPEDAAGAGAALGGPGQQGLVHVARSTGSVQRARSDTSIRAHGFVFDLEGFVNGPRRASRLAAFFAAFRHSQMFEVFVVERCAAAAQGYPLTDAFEAEVSDRVGQGASPLAAAAAAAAARGAGSRIGSLWRKTSDVVRQSSDTLVTAVRTLGTLQDDYPLPGQTLRNPSQMGGPPLAAAPRPGGPPPQTGRLAPLAAGIKSLDDVQASLYFAHASDASFDSDASNTSRGSVRLNQAAARPSHIPATGPLAAGAASARGGWVPGGAPPSSLSRGPAESAAPRPQPPPSSAWSAVGVGGWGAGAARQDGAVDGPPSAARGGAAAAARASPVLRAPPAPASPPAPTPSLVSPRPTSPPPLIDFEGSDALHARWLPARPEVFSPLAASLAGRAPEEDPARRSAEGPVGGMPRPGPGPLQMGVAMSSPRGLGGAPQTPARGPPSPAGPEAARRAAALAARAAESAALRAFGKSLVIGGAAAGGGSPRGPGAAAPGGPGRGPGPRCDAFDSLATGAAAAARAAAPAPMAPAAPRVSRAMQRPVIVGEVLPPRTAQRAAAASARAAMVSGPAAAPPPPGPPAAGDRPSVYQQLASPLASAAATRSQASLPPLSRAATPSPGSSGTGPSRGPSEDAEPGRRGAGGGGPAAPQRPASRESAGARSVAPGGWDDGGEAAGASPPGIPDNPYLLDTLRLAGGGSAWGSWRGAHDGVATSEAGGGGGEGEERAARPGDAAWWSAVPAHDRSDTVVERGEGEGAAAPRAPPPWADSSLPTMQLWGEGRGA